MLAIRNLEKSYPSSGGRPILTAVDSISFSVAKGDFFTLLGPSGCGKTTTLQCIAGLEDATGGEIAMGGELVFSAKRKIAVPSNLRNLGMIFQSYAIWPHKTVFENVAFPLVHGARKHGREEVQRRVMTALDMVKLAHLADRPSPFLSGGQQQRVALARAIVHQPRLLLLDEPLSNLDAKLRDTMRTELRNLVKSLGITTIFVTHDQVEAMAMSDEIVLMRSGRIVQRGKPRELYLSPKDAFTAAFMGRSNLIPGRIEGQPGRQQVDTPIGRFDCDIATPAASGTPVFLAFRQQSVATMETTGEAVANSFSGTVKQVTFLGDAIEVEAETGGFIYRALLDPYREFEVGQELRLTVPYDRLVVVPRDGSAEPGGQDVH